MEKIKNILHPGHKKDDDVMYGSGTHQSDGLNHTQPPVHASGAHSGTHTDATTSAGSHHHIDPRSQGYDTTRFDPAHSATGATSTGIPHTTSSTTATTGDRLTETSLPDRSIHRSDPQSTGSSGTHMAGTDRAFPLHGGVSTSGTLPVLAGKTPTIGTLSRDDNVLETPETEAARRERLAAAAALALKHDHRGHGHHYEGDPCPVKHDHVPGPHLTHGPHTTDTANRLDPHISPGEIDRSVIHTTDASGVAIAPAHHHGRDAVLGTGAGVGAAAATSSLTGHGHREHAGTGSTSTSGPHSSSLLNKLDPRTHSDASKTHGTEQHHHRRDAALAAGVGTLGAGAYGAGKHHGEQGSTYDPYTQRTVPGQHTHAPGAPATAVFGGAGAAGVAVANALTPGDQRTTATSTTQAPSTTDNGNTKHGGLLGGLLHRDKGDKHKTETVTEQHTKHVVDEDPHEHKNGGGLFRHHKTETAAGTGAAAVSAAALAHDNDHDHAKHERNRLHKDPPPGYTPHGLQHGGSVTEPHTGLPMNVTKYGDGHGGTDATRTVDGYNEHKLMHGAGGAGVGTGGPVGNATGAAGLTGAAGAAGLAGTSTTTGTGLSGKDGIVVEPHTGLPMNVGKYGDGSGGTDATPTIDGFHEHSVLHDHTSSGTANVRDEQLKKGNTIY